MRVRFLFWLSMEHTDDENICLDATPPATQRVTAQPGEVIGDDLCMQVGQLAENAAEQSRKMLAELTDVIHDIYYTFLPSDKDAPEQALPIIVVRTQLLMRNTGFTIDEDGNLRLIQDEKLRIAGGDDGADTLGPEWSLQRNDAGENSPVVRTTS